MDQTYLNPRAYIYVLIIVISLTLYIIITNNIAKIFFALLALCTLIFVVIVGMIYLMDKAGIKLAEYQAKKMEIKKPNNKYKKKIR